MRSDLLPQQSSTPRKFREILDSQPVLAAFLLTRYGRKKTLKSQSKNEFHDLLGIKGGPMDTSIVSEKTAGIVDSLEGAGMYNVDASTALGSLGALATGNPLFAGTAAAIGAPEGARAITGLKTLGGGALGGLVGYGLARLISRRGGAGKGTILRDVASKITSPKILGGAGVSAGTVGGTLWSKKEREKAERGKSVRNAADYLRAHLSKVGAAAPMQKFFLKLADSVADELA